jgi:hypothetical protein
VTIAGLLAQVEKARNGECRPTLAYLRAQERRLEAFVLAPRYQHLGIDSSAQYLNSAGRPMMVLPSVKPIEELC